MHKTNISCCTNSNKVAAGVIPAHQRILHVIRINHLNPNFLIPSSKQFFATSTSKKKKKPNPKYKQRKENKKLKMNKGKGGQRQQFHKPPKPPKRQKETNTEKNGAPPLFLYQTASPTVYISSIAIDNSSSSYNDDEFDNDIYDDGDITSTSQQIHPKSLFTETKEPHSFSNAKFEYISPKLFNYEYPNDISIPEIAILGRSNVGKSSLLNAITGSSDLARISKTPGRTQQVNYFAQFPLDRNNASGSGSVGCGALDKNGVRDIASNPPTGYIIDLPGYGK